MNEPLKGEIVEEYMLGNTKIKINNACYKNKTQAEIDAIIRRIEGIVINALIKQAVAQTESVNGGEEQS